MEITITNVVPVIDHINNMLSTSVAKPLQIFFFQLKHAVLLFLLLQNWSL